MTYWHYLIAFWPIFGPHLVDKAGWRTIPVSMLIIWVVTL